MTRSTISGIACGAAAGALWGLSLLAPELIGPFAPLQLASVRFVTYGVIALFLLAPRLKTLLPHLGKAEWLGLLGLSLMGNIIYYSLLSTAVQLCGVAMPSLIVGFIPVTVTVVGALRADSALHIRQLIPSMLLSAGGIICIAWQNFHNASPQHHNSLWLQLGGLLMATAALLSWTGFVVKNANWLKRIAPLSHNDWNLLTGLVTGGLALLMLPLAFLLPHHLPVAGWGRFFLIACGMGLLASIVANAFWNNMTRLLPLTMVGQMILFETLFSLFYGFLWEQRFPTLLEGCAIILAISGVISCVRAHGPAKHG
ncbi:MULTISPECIES: DMT family transporter [Bombella]|uniref:DMT family transporter n=1 Tax=Bombella pollinis TaxID=2967337 RepID=A0ABT3WM74_9PROT|nr:MULTISPECIES: DMT family transporter [Bombella]MCX5620229.1 DMT family transporter [Bombella pollinis]MUG05007.1 EamA family transporter [Bombella sp. ESL0378]